MKLTGSLKLDPLPIDQLAGDWRWAKNIVLNKRTNSISVEDGLANASPTGVGGDTDDYPTSKIVVGFYETAKREKIFFFASASNGASVLSEIGRIKSDGLYYPILKDATSKVVLDFRSEYPIQVVGENRFNDQTILAWTNNFGEIGVLNIDCIPFDQDSDWTVTSAHVNKAKALLKLFFDYRLPNVFRASIDCLEGQGNLSSGSYNLIIGYEADDGSITSWSEPYNPIPIFTSPITGTSSSISGGEGGEGTGKALYINFDNLDVNFRKIRVGYIYTAKGISKAYYVGDWIIPKSPIVNFGSALAVILTGAFKEELSLDEILVPNIVYKTAKTLTNFQKSLHIANLESFDDINFQTYANEITTKWVRGNIVYVESDNVAIHQTFQHPARVYSAKSFKSGECYAFFIRLKRKKGGTNTKWFHIPGREANAGDKDELNDGSISPAVDALYDGLDNGNPIYKYQIHDTHTQDTSFKGDMGYWENENEQYPLDPANALNVHPDYANIPGVTASDRNVRHHVFPSLRYIGNAGNTDDLVTADSAGLYGGTFGVEISNVNIPASILTEIDGWEIGYAERSNDNIRIIASDVMSKESGSLGWFNAFDLMVNRPNLSPKYLRPVWVFGNDGLTVGEEANFVNYMFSSAALPTNLADPDDINIIAASAYAGENTTIPYNNTGFADAFIVDLVNVLPGYPFDMGTAGVTQGVYLIDICMFKRNMYVRFANQNIITTGTTFKVAASGVQTAQSIWSGDVYLNRHSVNPLNSGTKALSYICESISNIGLRREDLALSKYFAPKYTNPTPSWFGYNSDYTCINKFVQEDIHYPDESCVSSNVTEFRNRIAYSIVQGDESKTFAWRIFKANSYYDNVRDKGEIWNILSGGRVLYIHHKYSLFLAQIKDALNTVGDEVALKSSGAFDRAPTEVIPTSEAKGFAGTQSQFACILCPLGYCFIDKEAAKVFIFNQNGLKEISDEGMFNFFIDHVLTIADGQNTPVDNPFRGNGYILFWDDKNNRLILTKRGSDNTDYQFTLSYSSEANNGKGGWVSFHDYFPNIAFSSRDGVYSVNNSLKKLFQHNVSSVKAKYYDGTIKESYIDIVHNEEPLVTKRYDSIEWQTSAQDSSGVNYNDDTFTHLIAYNEAQCSGKVTLKPAASGVWYSKNRRNVKGAWFYNNFRDDIKVVTNPFLDYKGDLITTNISSTKAWYKRSKFISKYITIRLITDNSSQKDLHFSNFDIKFTPSSR